MSIPPPHDIIMVNGSLLATMQTMCNVLPVASKDHGLGAPYSFANSLLIGIETTVLWFP